MPLVDSLNAATEGFERFAAALRVLTATPIRVDVAGGAPPSDRTEAEAIKRGQRPELIAALRQALGL